MNQCDICGSAANGFECDWPVEKFVRLPAIKLNVGDVVQRFNHATEKRRTQGTAHVRSVKERLGGWIHVSITIVWPWKEAVRQLVVKPYDDFMVKTASTCGAHVCDACMVERDANKMVICKGHWAAWEMIA